jgi:hypothetical protein
MAEIRSTSGGYALAALFGAVAGGISVLVLMMAQMGGEGCDPEEM